LALATRDLFLIAGAAFLPLDAMSTM
jgi:hypothetical protein